MIPATIVGLSLLVGVAIDPRVPDRPGAESPAHMSAQQKNAAVRPLVRSATKCVVQTISADPRIKDQIKRGHSDDLNQWVIDSIPHCAETMRALIQAYDLAYGKGTGETFFTDTYLELLPAVVESLISDAIEQ